MSGPFLDSPRDLERRIDRLVEHFRHAEWMFYAQKPKGIPSPSDLLWLLLTDAMDTVRRLPFTELRQVSAVRTYMPGARVTPADFRAMRNARLQAGMPEYDLQEPRQAVNQSAADRMVDVLDLLRFVSGKNADRMRRVCLARAAGMSLEQCGRIWAKGRTDFDRRAMHDIRSRVIGQILDGIAKHFGLVKTSRGFRRLTVREIEQRKKRRQQEERETAQ
ncbi:hypothetical protein [Chelativorans sp. AA-79]|uniref:hypothetical protein n=1 Tax=Chelativorans sp. AA-79 TaxID=3028735 RepID=UPI0023F7E54F|nr:hypothetical protein [Chelativorans sp. AA-79]WEX10320.1 hypothetical protein PVE73_05000 [Chelativorans sp. AA-79]